jgi:hypothetical protein
VAGDFLLPTVGMFYNLRLVTTWRASPRQENDEALTHAQYKASQGHLTGRIPRLSDLACFLPHSGVTHKTEREKIHSKNAGLLIKNRLYPAVGLPASLVSVPGMFLGLVRLGGPRGQYDTDIALQTIRFAVPALSNPAPSSGETHLHDVEADLGPTEAVLL